MSGLTLRIDALQGVVGALLGLLLLVLLAAATLMAVEQPESLAQHLVNGLCLGGLFALIALGYTMVYGIIELINFAHGEVFMVGSFLGLLALQALFGWGITSIFVALPRVRSPGSCPGLGGLQTTAQDARLVVGWSGKSCCRRAAVGAAPWKAGARRDGWFPSSVG